ncbi:MAG: restriction endonuclease subunit R [Candidatus Yanofskybacteria bacterium RIFCSPHIGHO2_01_FULL_41_26]|uniref:Restriction endonuclease subunit R n=1 Tax=Candidatus Yanofskybacteria bacterium RIFCSPHIGHO2_01_FULL_41_26 TaxID=1802661 RepID=A0A1F8ECQ3_9BACT|nr:MAG: restriction endonuclease subunit R [Candidatus Yanofskybacteria bacterium RIFCSPHIGHO2_01_FULL_41_26]
MQKEAKARIKINNLLQDSGWRFFDDEKGKANIVLENNTKITKKAIDEFGSDFEKTQGGFIDFLLLDEKGFPLVVLEAKSEDKDPLDGKEQARRYAQSQNTRFIILSNGNLHYFWDLERGNPSVITTFPTGESLKHFEAFKPSFATLAEEKVESDYIVLTQNPNYQKDPRWADETQRGELTREQDLKFLRPYQLSAIHALQKSAKEGRDRYLFEMATGTGKTLISGAVIKLFLKSGNAKRILFLVDRLELEDQAWKNFVRYLKNDFTCAIYKENKDDWRKAEIVVSTVQSLSFNNKYKKLFSPTDFDLVISDEAHRSIGGNSRAVFEYFVGYKLGLTATPKDYLKNIDPMKISEKDPRAWERRQLLDTYTTFGCESGEPTFRYSLLDGVKDGFLVNPIVADARTEITTELLSEKGYSLMVENEEGVEEEQTFFQKDFERKFFSEKTNQIFCKTFLENALNDPISGEIGKGIVFCVSQKHASKVTQILNQFADQLWPGKYNSDFALQITSNIPDAQQFPINFANNNLNGQTKWLAGYKSSKTRICVTVGMMTTGYDCQDVLNLCMMRPIFSPTDFIQIKGRGTRKYSFGYKDADNEITTAEKATFKLFDFFANCEYFEEKYNYDQVIKLPIKTGTGTNGGDGVDIDEINIFNPDPLKTFSEKAVGLAGMKVDWKFFDKFEAVIKNDPIAKEKYEQGDIRGVEEYVKDEIFDKPEDYFNLEKLRKSIKADRRVSLKEFIEKIFGGITAFKSKDELLEEEFEKFVAILKPDSKHILPIKNYLKAYITDPEIRDIVETKEYSRFATNPKVTMKDFKELNGYREIVPEYVKDYVSLNAFM